MTTEKFSDALKIENWKDRYFWIQALFYFLQGVFLAGIFQYGSIRLAEWDIPLAKQATFTAVTGMPAFLKMFIGLFSDRVIVGKWGRRKPYIIFGFLLTIPAYIFYLNAGDYTGLFIAQTMAVFAWAIIDTTLDALTVDVTPDQYDSQMQSFAQGGRYLGMALGMFTVPVLIPIIGWQAIIAVIGLFLIFMPLSALLIDEVPVTKEDLKGNMALGKIFKEVFSDKIIWLGIFASMLLYTGITAQLVSNHVLTNLHWAEDPAKMKVYAFASLMALVGIFIGAIIMGRIYRNTGFKIQTIYIATGLFLLLSATWIIFEMYSEKVWLFALCSFLRSVGGGFLVVTSLTIVMRICKPSIEGFIFALMSSVMNIGQFVISPKLLGVFLPKLGITASLYILAISAIIAVFLIKLIMGELDRRESVS